MVQMIGIRSQIVNILEITSKYPNKHTVLLYSQQGGLDSHVDVGFEQLTSPVFI